MILEAYPEYATAGDEAQLEVVLMQGDSKAIKKVDRCVDRIKYVCALCDYPDEFYHTGYRKCVGRSVAVR